MPAPGVPSCHSPFGRVTIGLTMIVLGLGTLVGCSPDPPRRAQMVVLLIIAGLVATSLWLRRCDRHAREQRLTWETATRAAAGDCLIIARELYDAVFGDLGAITVCCAMARRLETTPDGLRTILDDVGAASRKVTDALRRMLVVLWDENMSPMPGTLTAVLAEDVPVAGPGPVNNSAESLRELVDRARHTGVTVSLDADAPHISADTGTAQVAAMTSGLPAPTAQATTWAVAEILANAARHVGLTRARMALRRELG